MRSTAGKIALTLLVWLAAVAVVVTGELLPGDSTPMLWVGTVHVSDKLLHFMAYIVLAFIPCFRLPLRTGLKLCTLLVALGVALEFTQRLVPGRSFDLMDAVANTAGIVLGALLGAVGSRIHGALRRPLVQSGTRG